MDWQFGLVVPIFIKRHQRACPNYRGTIVVRLSGQICAKVPEGRLRYLNLGVRPDCGPADRFFTPARLSEGSWKYTNVVVMGLGANMPAIIFKCNLLILLRCLYNSMD